MCAASKPGSNRTALRRLRTNRPAPTSATTENATWAMTRRERRFHRALNEAGCPARSFRSVARSARVARRGRREAEDQPVSARRRNCKATPCGPVACGPPRGRTLGGAWTRGGPGEHRHQQTCAPACSDSKTLSVSSAGSAANGSLPTPGAPRSLCCVRPPAPATGSPVPTSDNQYHRGDNDQHHARPVRSRFGSQVGWPHRSPWVSSAPRPWFSGETASPDPAKWSAWQSGLWQGDTRPQPAHHVETSGSGVG